MKIKKLERRNALNICLVSPGYPPEDGGGIGTYTYNLAQGLTELGHKVFIITQTSCYEKEEVIDRVKIYRLKSRYIAKLEKYIPGLVYSMSVSHKIIDLDKKYGIDIVEFPNWEGVGFWYLKKKKRNPVVTRLHTPYFETLSIDKNEKKVSIGDRFTCWMEQEAVKRSDFLTSSTEYHWNFMARTYNILNKNIKIIPLGIEPPLFVENAHNSGENKTLKLLYVSRLEKRKGIVTLIEAIPKVLNKMSNVEFILIGKDRHHAPDGKTFKDYFFEKFKDYSDKVHFLGHVSPVELTKHYAECDIFVVPSMYESFGLIYIEAMAYEKPVIGCNTGGIPEVISNNISGFIVSPFDSEELALKILELCNNERLRKKMGIEGRKIVETKFNRERMARETSNLYREVIQQGISSLKR